MKKKIEYRGFEFTQKDLDDYEAIRQKGDYNMIMQGNEVCELLGWNKEKYTVFTFGYNDIVKLFEE